MNPFEKLRDEDRRLVILQLLVESPGYKANQYLLQTALDSFGHEVSIDLVRTDLAWLAEQRLVHLEEIGGQFMPSITARGLDVARGRALHPGVKRPRPA